MSTRTTFSLVTAALLGTAGTAEAQQRPMNFMDMQLMSRGGSWTPRPDREWMLYTVSTPDWEEAESQTDIWVVSMSEGVPSGRQLTFTDGHDETSPAWGPDGSYFIFRSDRDAAARRSDDDENGGRWQLYMMRHDGGEARRITDLPNGVAEPDGNCGDGNQSGGRDDRQGRPWR